MVDLKFPSLRGATCDNVHLKPRPHVSGYSWIRNFFFPDTASVYTYPVIPAYESATFLNPLSREEIF